MPARYSLKLFISWYPARYRASLLSRPKVTTNLDASWNTPRLFCRRPRSVQFSSMLFTFTRALAEGVLQMQPNEFPFPLRLAYSAPPPPVVQRRELLVCFSSPAPPSVTRALNIHRTRLLFLVAGLSCTDAGRDAVRISHPVQIHKSIRGYCQVKLFLPVGEAARALAVASMVACVGDGAKIRKKKGKKSFVQRAGRRCNEQEHVLK